MRTLLIIAALLAMSLAGCADDTAPVAEEETTEADGGAKATDTTGVIRGVVVDNTITPLEGANIKIKSTGAETTSLADGSFAFSDLAPGTYYLDVAKLGFETAQTTASVEAGVDKPPIIRVQLTADESYNPWAATQVYKGLYQCGTSVLVVCGIPNILIGQGTTDDTSTPDIFVAENPDFVQTEMDWTSTQAVSPNLYFEMEALHDDCTSDDLFLTNAEGASPIRARADNETLKDSAIGGACPIYHSVFAGDISDRALCVVPDNPVAKPCVRVGFSIQQDFMWYITEFHGFVPSEDWWFINDGEATPPQ